MIAVFQNWWKQYKVQKWDTVLLEKIDKKEWEIIEIKKVILAFDDKNIEVWTPFVSKTIKVKIVEQWRWDKITVFKMKAKKRYSKKYWHRQPFTKVEVMEIN